MCCNGCCPKQGRRAIRRETSETGSRELRDRPYTHALRTHSIWCTSLVSSLPVSPWPECRRSVCVSGGVAIRRVDLAPARVPPPASLTRCRVQHTHVGQSSSHPRRARHSRSCSCRRHRRSRRSCPFMPVALAPVIGVAIGGCRSRRMDDWRRCHIDSLRRNDRRSRNANADTHVYVSRCH